MLTAITIAITDRKKSSTITRLLRRASCWCSKKFTLGELDLRRFALLLRLDHGEQLGRPEAEHAGEDHVGKGLALGVVLHHRVVERLAREGDLVLGAGQLFLQRDHVL